MSDGRGALAGIRILDLTRILAGPYCTMFLGDLGADVVKIEQPGVGDDTRGWGPPFVGDESAYFLSVNRNKRSLTLNLKSERGAELLRRLAEKADVLIENFRPGAMDRLGLGEAEMRALNPRLIYVSLSAFGADGPMRDLPGYDLIVQACGGLMSVTGAPDGEPTKVGVAIVDLLAGLMLGNAISAALLARERSGVGQKIESSLLEAAVASLINVGSNYLVSGEVPGRWGNAHPSIVPFQSFKTSDGYLVVAAASERIWRRFCEAIDMAELAEDPRFAKNPERVRHRDELIRILAPAFAKKDTATWVTLLSGAEVPCSPVQTIDQVFSSPQVLHREMLVKVNHPKAGTIPLAGLPVSSRGLPLPSGCRRRSWGNIRRRCCALGLAWGRGRSAS
jgi:formyl-CoA transferase